MNIQDKAELLDEDDLVHKYKIDVRRYVLPGLAIITSHITDGTIVREYFTINDTDSQIIPLVIPEVKPSKQKDAMIWLLNQKIAETEIAYLLGISQSSVNNYRRNLIDDRRNSDIS